MDQHEYIAGFFGVLIGFTLTELIKGIAETFKNWHRITYYYPHALATAYTFFLIILVFFDFFPRFTTVAIWTPYLLMQYAFPSIFVCFFSCMLFPSFSGDEKIDFRSQYFKVSPIFCWLAILLSVLNLSRNIFFLDMRVFHFVNIALFLFFAFSILGLIIKKDWWQYFSWSLALVGIAYWTFSLALA